MAVEITSLVSFGGASVETDLIAFELDDEKNGTTSFRPGDVIFINVQVSLGVEILEMAVTHGAIQSQGVVEYGRTQFFDFVNKEENETFTLDRIPTGPITVSRYLGRQGAVQTSQNSNNVRSITGNFELAPYKAEIKYRYRTNLYRLQTPNVTLGENETYPITVVLYLNKQSSEANNGCNG